MAFTGGSGSIWGRLAALARSIVPGTDNTYDLGSATKRWAFVYAALAVLTTLTVTNIVMTAGVTGYINISDNMSNALQVQESNNSYLRFTTSDNEEMITIGQASDPVDLSLGNGTMYFEIGNISSNGSALVIAVS